MKEESLERVERLLGLMLMHLMKGSSQAEKALQLSLGGFSNIEIANLLQTTQGVVAQYLYTSRKKLKKP